MPTPLKYFKSDPEKKGRGSGYYYRRKVKGKLTYSKYSAVRDAKYKAEAKIKHLNPKYQHAGDLHHKKRVYKKIKVSPKKEKKFFGWF